MITATRSGFGWRNIELRDESGRVAEIVFSAWSAKAEIRAEGITFEARKLGVFKPGYQLLRGSQEVARVSPVGFWRRPWDLHWNSSTLRFKPRNLWTRRFIILDGETEVGSVGLKGIWNNQLIGQFPSNMNPPLQAFLVWLCVVLWRRASAGAAAS